MDTGYKNNERNSGIVFIKNPHGEGTIKIESIEQLEEFLKSEELTRIYLPQLIWDSLQEAFRSGKRVGRRQLDDSSFNGGYSTNFAGRQ